ncbi:DUF3108 domain-containing protein [Vibrio sp. Of7-15]|uniref:DUF3108 domain-containing protein n=1 Tax=Vibrio sp. Of7-15 TaxID=2724879 RepID=UPI001EF28C07|nr:DUF3108 domain-containing protein [Vibrio sp. Of7-15]MCG7496451.1 DUF3108 domain-containing protein [Vibrio sp. Of7-15]
MIPKISRSILALSLMFSACSAADENQHLQATKQPVNINKSFSYDVSYKGINIGDMVRELQWRGNSIKANITADFSFLFMDFGGNQQSKISWQPQSEEFLTRSFIRNTDGFSSVRMEAEFSEDGHNSQITNLGEKLTFSNADHAIIDFNTLALEIRHGVMSGEKQFEIFMQTSDDIAHYFFEVKGKEMVNTEFGPLSAYRIEQIKKDDRTLIIWVAPSIDHQMVKFHYQRRILDISGEMTKHSITVL